uniref:SP-RING-type domain-containing protein n=1 Tax=Nothoprocta perdicaria TaxID=30464 RepID=A0A8C6YWQ5_NOTPE
MVPCRAITCTHLQCFDAALYLQMNEKKPKTVILCAPLTHPRHFSAALSPGRLFMEILNSCTDCDEIQFMEDGSWCPMKPKKENQEVCQTSLWRVHRAARPRSLLLGAAPLSLAALADQSKGY